MDFLGLDVLNIDAIVADVRISQCDDLPTITGIREDLLVTGERGVKHHFAHGVAGETDRGA